MRTYVPTNTPTGRRHFCLVCTSDPDGKLTAQILMSNQPYAAAIAQMDVPFSLRQFKTHTSRCLGKHWETLRKQGHSEHVNAVQQQFVDWLEEAHELFEAAKDVLLVDDELNLNPREWEVNVVYLDHNDVNQQTRQPKLKTAPLSKLLAKLTEAGYEPQHSYIKAEDARKTIRESMTLAESLLDKLAKITGAYKEVERTVDLKGELQKALMNAASKLGHTYQEEARWYLESKGDQLNSELREWLAGEVGPEPLALPAMTTANTEVFPLVDEGHLDQ